MLANKNESMKPTILIESDSESNDENIPENQSTSKSPTLSPQSNKKKSTEDKENKLDKIIHNWAITDSKVVETSFAWTIKNLSYYKNNKRLLSPTFEEETSRTKLYLNFNLDQQGKNADYCGIFLYLQSSSLKVVKTKFQLAFMNNKEMIKTLEVYSLTELFYEFDTTSNKGFGFGNLIKKNDLFENTVNLLPDDTLTIFCEIKILSDLKNTLSQNKKLELSVNSTQMVYDFNQLLTDGLYNDLTILVEERKILVHKSILSARSVVFHQIIGELNRQRVVKISDYTYDIMYEVMRYIYTNKVENLKLHAIDLLTAADKFKIQGLKLICEKYLEETLNIINVATMLYKADISKANELKAKLIDYIITHAKEVVSTEGYKILKNSYPCLVAEIFSKMALKRPSSPRDNKKHNNKRRR